MRSRQMDSLMLISIPCAVSWKGAPWAFGKRKFSKLPSGMNIFLFHSFPFSLVCLFVSQLYELWQSDLGLTKFSLFGINQIRKKTKQKAPITINMDFIGGQRPNADGSKCPSHPRLSAQFWAAQFTWSGSRWCLWRNSREGPLSQVCSLTKKSSSSSCISRSILSRK